LTMKTLARELTNPKEWVFCTVGRMRGFFLCLGGTKIYHFGGAKWNAVKEKIELMNNTLVYADLVDEIKVNGANRDITAGFHIIDALILGKLTESKLTFNWFITSRLTDGKPPKLKF